jgi:hypothetical protein
MEIKRGTLIYFTYEAYKNEDSNKVFSKTKHHMQPYAATDTRKIEK